MGEVTQRRAALALLILRLSLGVFLLEWSVGKLVVPEAAIRIAHFFYGVALSSAIAAILGTVEAVLALALLTGIARRWSYGLATLVHALSVGATWRQLMYPHAGHNDLYLAGVPVLAAFLLLYLLRDWDAYSVEGWRRSR